jgi:hypothetical protein
MLNVFARRASPLGLSIVAFGTNGGVDAVTC